MFQEKLIGILLQRLFTVMVELAVLKLLCCTEYPVESSEQLFLISSVDFSELCFFSLIYPQASNIFLQLEGLTSAAHGIPELLIFALKFFESLDLFLFLVVHRQSMRADGVSHRVDIIHLVIELLIDIHTCADKVAQTRLLITFVTSMSMTFEFGLQRFLPQQFQSFHLLLVFLLLDVFEIEHLFGSALHNFVLQGLGHGGDYRPVVITF